MIQPAYGPRDGPDEIDEGTYDALTLAASAVDLPLAIVNFRAGSTNGFPGWLGIAVGTAQMGLGVLGAVESNSHLRGLSIGANVALGGAGIVAGVRRLVGAPADPDGPDGEPSSSPALDVRPWIAPDRRTGVLLSVRF